MSGVFSNIFWRDTAERAVKTFAQSLVAALGVTASPGDLLAVDWISVLGIAGFAAVMSVGTSVASSKRGDQESASFSGRIRISGSEVHAAS